MNYPDYLKIEAVKIFRNTKNAEAALDEIRVRHQATVSRRSLFLWAKDPRYNDAENSSAPVLFLDMTGFERMQEARKKTLNLADLVEKNKEYFQKSNEKLDKLIQTLVSDLKPEEVKALSTKDKISALCKLENLKIKKHEFLLALIAQAGEGEDEVSRLMDNISKSLNGIDEKTIDTEVVE